MELSLQKELTDIIHRIKPLDQVAMQESKIHWDQIAKPLGSLGKLETNIIQIAGMQRTARVDLAKKALVVMCADNGVVEEGVTQAGQEVTAIIAENFLDEKSCVALMCKDTRTDIFPIDIGMAVDTKRVEKRKIAYGTKNIVKDDAMTRQEALRAIVTGVEVARRLGDAGYQIIATGEMGIGNTTTSSAVCAVLLHMEVERVTGRGAGLSSEGLIRKTNVIKSAIQNRRPNPKDPIDVLAKVGGFDIAGLVGVYLGGAEKKIPVVIDGFISAVAALIAIRICPQASDYILASHISSEPAGILLLEEMKKDPCLICDMCLGEGTGAVALFPLLEMGLHIYNKMSTFEEIKIENYKPFN
ncbi:nicotinate-nucleotide--dimethylbenzimidazole phosphoribosyltransferase [Lachnospiraceae bacterium ZAX-1]